MGFMDKAKKLAEQAQEKLDEAQKQFNQSQAVQGDRPEPAAVRYDEQAGPIPDPPAPRRRCRRPRSTGARARS